MTNCIFLFPEFIWFSYYLFVEESWSGFKQRHQSSSFPARIELRRCVDWAAVSRECENISTLGNYKLPNRNRVLRVFSGWATLTHWHWLDIVTPTLARIFSVPACPVPRVLRVSGSGDCSLNIVRHSNTQSFFRSFFFSRMILPTVVSLLK